MNPPPLKAFRCLWCADTVRHIAGRGWVHDSDNTTVRTREELRTDWRGETAIAVLDDHIATPDYGPSGA